MADSGSRDAVDHFAPRQKFHEKEGSEQVFGGRWEAATGTSPGPPANEKPRNDGKVRRCDRSEQVS